MKETLLEILIYAYHHHQYDTSPYEKACDKLVKTIESTGVTIPELRQKIDAMEKGDSGNFIQGNTSTQAIRHYCPEEIDKISADGRGFLQLLQDIGLLSPENREEVVHRAMFEIESDMLTATEIKWLVYMVMSRSSIKEVVHTWIENQAYQEDVFVTCH